MTSLFALSALIVVFVSQAQQTDEGKPILKARAVDSSSGEKSPTPTAESKASPAKKKKAASASPSPKKKAKAKKSSTEDSEAAPTPSEAPEAASKPKTKKPSKKAASPKPSETPEATAHPKPKKSGAKESSPKGKKKKKATSEKSPTPKKKSSAKPSETPEARATATPPRAVAVPSPAAPPSPVPRAKSALAAPVQEPEQLTIEKYGYEKPRGFWSRLFSGGDGRSSSSGAGYRYLTASVRNQIDRAPVARGRWQYIVVHNSGTRQGNAAAFDYYHRHFRRMQNGLAYHFVIGNGTSTGNGQVEIGDRWRRQINGGHVHSDYLNNIALGICLVGDFNRDQPTRAQLDCCEELIRYLRQRCGKVGDHWPIVKPHRDINPPRWPTDCPGDVFPYSWFRRFQE
jgi:hypothetical protein